jgi:hypothetical protein
MRQCLHDKMKQGEWYRSCISYILLMFWWYIRRKIICFILEQDGMRFYHAIQSDMQFKSYTLQSSTLLFEQNLQFILLWLFWRWGLMNYFPGLVSNHNPPYESHNKIVANFSLGIKDYRVTERHVGNSKWKKKNMWIKDSVSTNTILQKWRWQSS